MICRMNKNNKHFKNLAGGTSSNDWITFFLLKDAELIKNNFDLCIVSSWRGARLAYLAGLKFIFVNL